MGCCQLGGCLLEVKESDLFHLEVFISAINNGTHARHVMKLRD